MTFAQSIRVLSLACLVMLAAPSTFAQGLFRAYLSLSGSDANPCTLPQPCRLLPAALGAVADGGEVWMLNSANYNATTVNVAKSVTILAVPGEVGSVVSAGGPAINIATPAVKVTLRNLVIVPLPGGGGTDGVAMSSGALLAIEGSRIVGHSQAGVRMTAAGLLRIVDSAILDNGQHGVVVSGPGLVGRASIQRSSLSGNAQKGLYLDASACASPCSAGARVDLADSVVSGNGTGLYGTAFGGLVGAGPVTLDLAVSGTRITQNTQGIAFAGTAPTQVAIGQSTLALNTTAVDLNNAFAEVALHANTISGNSTVFTVTNGAVVSGSNNLLRGNGTLGTSPTPVSLQ